MKIPPRAMFWGQVAATIVAGTVQLGVQAWLFANVEDMCQMTDETGFICPSTEVFGLASVLWGVIGPALQFSKGQLYYPLLWGFFIGFMCPIVVWVISWRYPNTPLLYLNFPLIFGGAGEMPTASALNFVPWAFVGFIFQYVIRKRHFGWWAKYNFVLSGALDAGVAISTVLIFFCLQYPKNSTIGLNTIQAWWGNTVYLNTADWNYTSWKGLADGAIFGPSSTTGPDLAGPLKPPSSS